MHSFGAVFMEVAVDLMSGPCGSAERSALRRRAHRQPRLAASQCTGGMVGGIAMALMERTVLDGRSVNAHMADYPVPVNPRRSRARGAFRR
jgi:xanthine dehydrogenase YagR molybdenum-binding subunit